MLPLTPEQEQRLKLRSGEPGTPGLPMQETSLVPITREEAAKPDMAPSVDTPLGTVLRKSPEGVWERDTTSQIPEYFVRGLSKGILPFVHSPDESESSAPLTTPAGLAEGLGNLAGFALPMKAATATTPFLTGQGFTKLGANIVQNAALGGMAPGFTGSRASEAMLWGGFPIAGKLAGQGFKTIGGALKTPWEKLVATPLEIAGAKITSIPIIPKSWEERFHGRTLQELFQAAEERMPAPAAAAFRTSKRNTAIASQQAQEVSNAIKPLNVDERYFTLKFFTQGVVKPSLTQTTEFMKMPLESRQKVVDAFAPIADWISTTTAGQTKRTVARDLEFRTRMATLFGSQDLARLESLQPATFANLKSIMNNPQTMNSNALRKELGRVLEDTTVPDATKNLAKGLYNLTADTLDNLPRAAQAAETKVLISKIKDSTVWSSSTPREGFVPSKHTSFQGRFVAKDIEDGLRELQYTPTLARSWYNKYFLSPWKMGKVVLRIPTHFRNVMGNIILNDWGGLPWYRGDIYAKAMNEVRTNGPHARELRKLTGVATTFANVEMPHFSSQLRYGATALDHAEAYFFNNKLVQNMAQWYQAEEAWAKTAKYMHNLEKGMTKRQAANDAVKWTFNYGEVTPFVAAMRVSALPFVTWQAKVLPLMFETVKSHPLRFAKWAMLPSFITQAALSNTGVSEDEWKGLRDKMPEFYQGGLQTLLPWRNSRGELQMLNFAWILPGIGDVAEIQSRGMGMNQVIQNPFLSLYADMRNHTTESGAPIYMDWDRPEVKAYRLLTHASQQLLPSLFAQDIPTMYKAFDEQKGALTPGGAVASQFGFRAKPVDPSEVRRQFAAKQSRQAMEVKMRMSSEMRRSNNEQEKQQIRESYARDLKRVYGKE